MFPARTSAPGAPKSTAADVEFLSRKACSGDEHSCEHSQPARRSAAEIWLRASQFCGALRCPVSFAVAPPGLGTIYRGPELNGPRTKRHYISEKMPPFATAIAVVLMTWSHTCPALLRIVLEISSNRRYPRIARIPVDDIDYFCFEPLTLIPACRSACFGGNLRRMWNSNTNKNERHLKIETKRMLFCRFLPINR